MMKHAVLLHICAVLAVSGAAAQTADKPLIELSIDGPAPLFSGSVTPAVQDGEPQETGAEPAPAAEAAVQEPVAPAHAVSGAEAPLSAAPEPEAAGAPASDEQPSAAQDAAADTEAPLADGPEPETAVSDTEPAGSAPPMQEMPAAESPVSETAVSGAEPARDDADDSAGMDIPETDGAAAEDAEAVVQSDVQPEQNTDAFAAETAESGLVYDEPEVSAAETAGDESDGIIWVDVADADGETAAGQAQDALQPAWDEPVAYRSSRAVTLQLGQSLEVVYPGRGWMYMGETKEPPALLQYAGQTSTERDTVFTLVSERSGTSQLYFAKKDALAGAYIRDFLDVTVSDAQHTAAVQTVTAPSYAEFVPAEQDYVVQARRRIRPAAADTGSAAAQAAADAAAAENRGMYYSEPNVDTASPIDTSEGDGIPAGALPAQEPQRTGAEREDVQEALAAQPAPPASESEQSAAAEAQTAPDAADYLAQAQQAYDSGDYESAASYINEYIANSAQRLDEALYLKGRIFEADSAVQNIKIALASYRAVVSGWPESPLWSAAHERAIYLERFYFSIR